MRSPYRGLSRRVTTTPVRTLPGAPTVRRVAPITRMASPDVLRDDLRPVAVNSDQRVRRTAVTRPDASGHGRYVVQPLPPMPLVHGGTVAAVTGRKARKSPGWSSKTAGGIITAPGV